jgi:hypothetical protein
MAAATAVTMSAVLFVILVIFSSLTFDGTICLKNWQGLVPVQIVEQKFYYCRLFAALVRVTTKIRASVIGYSSDWRRYWFLHGLTASAG